MLNTIKENNMENESSLSILYIEDEETIRNSIFKVLNRRFTKCYVATNGKEGLNLYNQHRPDIIVTDIQMPVMDGLEMVKIIRQNDVEIPIIVTSAYNNSDFLLEAIQMKVDSFVLKPITIEELIDRISRCAKKVQFRSFEQIFHFVAEQMSKGLILVNEMGKIYYANDAFINSTGFEASEIISSSFINDDDTLSPFQISSDIWKKLINKNEVFETVLKKRKSTNTYYQERTIFPIENNNKITNFVFMSQDVTGKQLEINALVNEAKHDSLTGLFRRSVLEQNIEKIIMQNKSFTFAMIDIDFFKSINDEFGHDVGDKVLKQFSSIVSSHLRSDDMSFRWGGEEFLLLFVTNSINDIFMIVERIRECIGLEDFDIGRSITASIGLAKYNSDEDWVETLKRADKALYKAKNSGRNKTCREL